MPTTQRHLRLASVAYSFAVAATVIAMLVAIASCDAAKPTTPPASPSRHLSTAHAAQPVAPMAASPAEKAGPVIIVPGYGGDRSMLDPLASALRKVGRTVIVLELPGNATGDLHGQAQVLKTAVDAQLHDGVTSVDLVGYSAGGVVVALFVKADPAAVRRVVSIGSPLHGTKLASLAQGLAPSACPTACEQMTPGSDVLAEISDAAAARTGVRWLSMWTTHDEVVIPASSARFDGARNVDLQSICADDDADHIALPSDPLVIGLTVSALNSWPIPFPTPTTSDCSPLRALG